MSDNYKVIRRAQEAINKLLNVEKWSINQVVKTIDITHTLVKEIRDQDPVTVNIREVSVEKLRVFLDKYEAGIEKPPTKRKNKLTLTKKEDRGQFDVTVPESMVTAIPPDVGMQVAPGAEIKPAGSGNDLMDDLNAIIARFKLKGYKVDVMISRFQIEDPNG